MVVVDRWLLVDVAIVVSFEVVEMLVLVFELGGLVLDITAWLLNKLLSLFGFEGASGGGTKVIVGDDFLVWLEILIRFVLDF